MRKQLRLAVLVLCLVFFGLNLAMACATIAPEAMTKGAELVRAGKSQEAIDQFNIGLADGYNNRGEACQIAGMWSEALADFNNALAINDKIVFAYFGRSLVYDAKGDAALAQADLNKVRQMDASLAELYAKKAKDLKNYGLVKGARRYLKYSFIINPDLKNKYKDLDQELNPALAAVPLEKHSS